MSGSCRPLPTPDATAPGAPDVAVHGRPAGAVAVDAESLLERALRAGPRERQAVQAQVIVDHVPLARAVAARYRDRGESYDDLVQVACVALVKAVRRYRPGRGVSFAAYAVPTITGELRRHFRDHAWAVRPPRRVQELRPRVTSAHQDLTQELHRPPTATELAARLGVSCGDVVETLTASQQYRCLSLDAPRADEEDDLLPLCETLGDADERLERVVELSSLTPLLSCLSARDRRILCLRFFCGLTQREIAEDIGVTQMQVSRLISQALRRMRATATTGVTAATD